MEMLDQLLNVCKAADQQHLASRFPLALPPRVRSKV